MTDDLNARPTISERYGVAVGSGTSMQHMILAAGIQPERLGSLLLRLQGEYDTVRGALERAGEIAPDRTAQARELTRRAALAKRLQDHAAAAVLEQQASEIRKRTQGEVLTARVMILLGLQSLQSARQRVGAWAIGIASHPKIALRPDVARVIAGQVLDVWLDPTCHTCDGTGQVGNAYAGEQRRQCSTCHGSGHRRDIIGRSDRERLFARDLLAEMQRRVAVAAGGMGRALAQAA